jgi:D-Tyr-tRNAtyr deacylase
MKRAEDLYEYLLEKCKQNNLFVGKGVFREAYWLTR